jgi:phenazine biosynthesis protein phzE
MSITAEQRVPLSVALTRLPDESAALSNGHFDIDDEEYAELVKRIVSDEIGSGQGANFVIKRSFVADISDYSSRIALSVFNRLLRLESGAYWIFLVHTGALTLVGATPERHLSLRRGTAVMNPVSGTYRYPPTGPSLDGLIRFLGDRKETDELYMVLDEELKMMARICPAGGRVRGPFLKEMACLAHTEYYIEGHTDRDVRELLRETLFAPTVTGSPLESASTVIHRYEPRGRRYYSGVVGLIGRDRDGGRTLDSAILIRTAEIDPSGRLSIGVGATLVRHSDPRAEAMETRAKVAGLLSAVKTPHRARFGGHPSVQAALRSRNDDLAAFWMRTEGRQTHAVSTLSGLRVLIIDAEDTFTAMIGHQLTALGLEVRLSRFDEPHTLSGYDLVVVGPGPGDPRRDDDRKIAQLRSTLGALLKLERPFVAVCLSHQVLSRQLGLNLIRRDVPNQGVQKTIDFFGTRERVGFYNTFAARAAEDKQNIDGIGVVEVCRDRATGEVHALRGPRFFSMQFHAESVLTVDGPGILTRAIDEVLA